MFEVFVINFLPLLKEFLPWVIILGGIIKWWWERKDKEETASLTRLEMLSKAEQRLRETLEKQLQVTEAKLDIATRELERMKLMLVKYEIELEKLKAELNYQRNQPPE